jgi:hypothetical protein
MKAGGIKEEIQEAREEWKQEEIYVVSGMNGGQKEYMKKEG